MAFAQSASAGGSLQADEVLAVLKTEPKLAAPFLAGFEFEPVATAVRMGNNWPHLGGKRIAPYVLRATSKDASRTNYLVTVHCSQKFLDADGKVLLEVADTPTDEQLTDEIFEKTVKVVEKVTSVSVKLRGPDDDQ